MTADDHEANKEAHDEFSRLLDRGEDAGKKIVEKGRELTEAGQLMVDLSQSTKNIVQIYKPARNVEELIQDWGIYVNQANQVVGEIGDVVLPTFNSTGGTAFYTTNASFNPVEIRSRVSDDEWPKIEVHIAGLQSIGERVTNKSEVIKLLKDFGLDAPPSGKKAPLELFETAHDAFEKPVSGSDPVITSLIPIREAIKLSIEELLRQRPRQEPAGNARLKIVSIVSQLKRDEIPTELIESWADQWHRLLDDDLSSAKNANIPRDEWRYRLNQTTLFLQNLLLGLEADKMRSRL